MKLLWPRLIVKSMFFLGLTIFASVSCASPSAFHSPPAMREDRPSLWRQIDLHIPYDQKSEAVISVYRDSKFRLTQLTVTYKNQTHKIAGTELEFMRLAKFDAMTGAFEPSSNSMSITLTVPYFSDDAALARNAPSVAYIIVRD